MIRPAIRSRVATFATRLILSTLAIASVAFSAPASAQTPPPIASGAGMDLHLFRPAIDSKGMFTVNGTDILGENSFSFGLMIDGGFGIYPFNGFTNDPNTQAGNAGHPRGAYGQGRLVDVFGTGVLHFNYGLGNIAIVGIQLPIQALAGQNVTIPGQYNLRNPDSTGAPRGLGLSYQGVGNLGIHTKFRFLRAERDPIGLAAILQIEFGTGAASSFAGEPGPVALWPSLAIEYRPIREIRIAGNVGTRLNFSNQAILNVGGTTNPTAANALAPALTGGNNLQYGSLLTFGLGTSFRLADAFDLTVEGYGAQILNQFGVKGALSIEAVAGFKVFVERNSYLTFGGGAGIPTGGWATADIRAFLGFVFEPSIGDRDGDGIRDDADSCPDEPEDFDGFEDEDGCPEPDNDHDGILDVNDDCPLVPEDFDGEQDEDGCPEGSVGDRDGDGILDEVDQCPDVPEDRDGFQDEDGCPEPDNDQDGILDGDDLCPNSAEDRDGFQDEDGCPEPDNDRDRILDTNDACPNEPETYNGTDDTDGCPDQGSVIVEDNQIIILEKIYFETGSAEILARSFPIIDAVAATLNGNPQIQFIEIQGHADERGNDDYNLRLTQARAASVLDAMVQRGVASNRMRSAGYGERCPVDPRSVAEAWEKNRRVEFKILRTDQGPTGVEVACRAGADLIPE